MNKIENLDDVAVKLACAVLKKTTLSEFSSCVSLVTEELAQMSVNLFIDIKRQLENKNQ
jgi:hypothetical protein